MSEHHKNLLKNSSSVAIATTICRLLGLVREMLSAFFLGGGIFASAWGVAFMVPNMFRRLLGEGALGSALMPIVAGIKQNEGDEGVKRNLATILAYLGALLALISITVSLASLAIEPFITVERVKLPLQLLPILMPYAFFICMIGAIGAVLNTYKVFFLPALGALSFNICMITVLLSICPFIYDAPMRMLNYLSMSVLVSGVLQLSLVLYLLKKLGILPQFRLSALKENLNTIKELKTLVIPGLIGASAVQIGFLIDRGCALFLNDHAVAALNYTDRIIDLPIGIFAVSFGAVSLSNLSHSAAKNNYDDMINSMLFLMRHLLFISIPTMVFFIIFRYPIISVFFERGRFDEFCVRQTAWSLLFFSFGIPVFSTVKILLTGFYANKDMKTPVKISFLCIGVNVALNFVLMWHLEQGGIALATVISSVLNNALLYYFLRKKLGHIPLSCVFRTSGLSLLLSTVFGLLSLYIFHLTPRIKLPHVSADLFPLISAGISFWIFYIAVSLICKSREVPEILAMFSKRRKGPEKS